MGSLVEHYDIKLAADNKGNLDVRLQFIDGKPEAQVMVVKKDEDKLFVTDMLCLHRYDFMIEKGNRSIEQEPGLNFVDLNYSLTLNYTHWGTIHLSVSITSKITLY